MDNLELWTKYKEKPDPLIKKDIVKKYLNLVHYIINRSKFVNVDIMDNRDYFQFGIEGLSEAIDRYDPDFGTKFETYAIQRIRGKIIDELRKIQIKPRSAVNPDDKKPIYSNVSLTQTVNKEDGYQLNEIIPNNDDLPQAIAEKNQEKEFLKKAISELDEKARIILSLYYYEDLTYKEIAKVLNITVSRISQIHSSVIKKLKVKLEKKFKD